MSLKQHARELIREAKEELAYHSRRIVELERFIGNLQEGAELMARSRQPKPGKPMKQRDKVLPAVREYLAGLPKDSPFHVGTVFEGLGCQFNMGSIGSVIADMRDCGLIVAVDRVQYKRAESKRLAWYTVYLVDDSVTMVVGPSGEPLGESKGKPLENKAGDTVRDGRGRKHPA